MTGRGHRRPGMPCDLAGHGCGSNHREAPEDVDLLLEPRPIHEWEKPVVAEPLAARGNEDSRSAGLRKVKRRHSLAAGKGQRDIRRVGIDDDDIGITRWWG